MEFMAAAILFALHVLAWLVLPSSKKDTASTVPLTTPVAA